MTFVSNLGLAFNRIVRLYPDNVALRYPDSSLEVTYDQLGELADRLAAALDRVGLKHGDVVAIFHDKSPAAFAVTIACLKMGVAYTNLDPESPRDRLRKILASCKPRLVLNAFSSKKCFDELESGECGEFIDLRLLVEQSESRPEPTTCRDVPGSMPAYIMFTSGSTGQPKGAVMSHANVLSFIEWGQDRFGVTPDDVFSNVNPIFFDNSIFDFYTAIFSGSTLVPFAADAMRDPRFVVHAAGEAGCTIWFSVPSLLIYLLTTRTLTAASFPSVRKIIFGGEGFPKSKLKRLYDLFSSRSDLENVYGPTECTCICSAHTISADDFADMQSLATLGRLSQNFAGEILPLDDGEPAFGELLLFGPQVGLGYYNDPIRTAQSFVQNPHHNLYRDIGYRTGDLVRRDVAGKFHFKGRVDFQIKHMGYRIELEEIEAALGALQGVKECAVIYERLGDGLGRIVGFVAVEGAADEHALISDVARIVPSYMVPKIIRILPCLPKNANGKIDRQTLKQMQSK